MAGFTRHRSRFWQGRFRYCALGLVLCISAASAHSLHAKLPARKSAVVRDPWQAAVAARRSFEAEPSQEHSREEFTQAMDHFRAIYHANPASVHAPAAVEQVAELLAEQGRQLHDVKSRRAAAGQYEFLAKAYPASTLAVPALEHALDLLEAGGAEDRPEALRLRAELKERYPHTAAQRSLAPRPPAEPGERGFASAPAVRSPVTDGSAEALPAGSLEGQPLPEGTAPAVVTGIRHWSTATYTRVAIDLGGEVQYKAARTEHPDRIFFDLHGAKLAPGLAGKTFSVTDDGFLSTIRAAQAGPDVTRVVLDVQPVAEYSAFLLPNPYRLIIDIHGKTAEHESAAATQRGPGAAFRAEHPGVLTRNNQGTEGEAAPVAPTPAVDEARQQPAPVIRGTGDRSPGVSSLPPMPVTDGSASFGLPPRRASGAVAEAAVARPRVVVTAKPTAARPVPNTVTSTTPDSNREVAALGETPGVVTATSRPTREPVVARSADRSRDAGAEASPNGTEPNPVHRRKSAATSSDAGNLSPAAPVAPPPPTSEGQSTLMRALGLKIGRIVIDAGHGGHDSGTLGADGIEEKDVVLDVALRLGKLLHDRLGAEVVYTRADDTFVPLETRTAIANKAQADLFISVHANSSQDPAARGVEVYYLNFTSDPEAMQVASRENAVSSQRVNQLSDLVKKIALKDKIDESRELAADVDQSLYAGLKRGNGGLKDRGVKKAPFVVLIGANMPSVLAEISFVTNPQDAAELQQPEYRERVAESLYNGIARYAGAINGTPEKSKHTPRTERAALKSQSPAQD